MFTGLTCCDEDVWILHEGNYWISFLALGKIKHKSINIKFFFNCKQFTLNINVTVEKQQQRGPCQSKTYHTGDVVLCHRKQILNTIVIHLFLWGNLKEIFNRFLLYLKWIPQLSGMFLLIKAKFYMFTLFIRI